MKDLSRVSGRFHVSELFNPSSSSNSENRFHWVDSHSPSDFVIADSAVFHVVDCDVEHLSNESMVGDLQFSPVLRFECPTFAAIEHDAHYNCIVESDSEFLGDCLVSKDILHVCEDSIRLLDSSIIWQSRKQRNAIRVSSSGRC